MARNRNILPWPEFVASLEETRHLARKIILIRCILLLRNTAHYGNSPAHVVCFTVSRHPGSATSGDALVVIQDMYRKQSRKVPATRRLSLSLKAGARW